MTRLWRDEFILNLPEIDAQHKHFFNLLEQVIKYRTSDNLTVRQLQELFKLILDCRTYGYAHFSTEEKLMITEKYPEFIDHMEKHDKYIYQMNTLRRAFVDLFIAARAGANNPDEIKSFIGDFINYVSAWWQEHISKEDAKYAYFIRRLSANPLKVV